MRAQNGNCYDFSDASFFVFLITKVCSGVEIRGNTKNNKERIYLKRQRKMVLRFFIQCTHMYIFLNMSLATYYICSCSFCTTGTVVVPDFFFFYLILHQQTLVLVVS